MSIVSRLGRLAARQYIKAAMAEALPGAIPAPKPIPAAPKPIPTPMTPKPIPAAPTKMPVLGGSVAPPQPVPEAPEASYVNPAFVEARRLEDTELAERRRRELGQQRLHNSEYMRALGLSRRQSADSEAQILSQEGSDEEVRLAHQMGEIRAEVDAIKRTLPPQQWPWPVELPPDIGEDLRKRERELLQVQARRTSEHEAQRKQLDAAHTREQLWSKRLN